MGITLTRQLEDQVQRLIEMRRHVEAVETGCLHGLNGTVVPEDLAACPRGGAQN